MFFFRYFVYLTQTTENDTTVNNTTDPQSILKHCYLVVLTSNIAQIGRLSFQAAIEHKPRQVRWGGLHAPVVTEWWPACLHKQFPRVHQRGN